MASVLGKLKNAEQVVVKDIEVAVSDAQSVAKKVEGEFVYYSSLIVPEMTIWLGGIEHKAVGGVLKLKKIFADELDALLGHRVDLQQNLRKLDIAAAEAKAKADIAARLAAANGPIQPVAARVPMGAEAAAKNPNFVERQTSSQAGKVQQPQTVIGEPPKPVEIPVVEEGVVHNADLTDKLAGDDPNAAAENLIKK